MEHKFEKAKKFFTEIKKTVYLWKNLWKEGTTALMRAPRTTDKTAAALEIAAGIADEGSEVLYVNAEQCLDNCPAVESDNLYIFTPEYSSPEDTTDYADLVFEAIEQAVATTSIRTFVIDSISRIAALSFGRNASVAYLMKRFVALQVKSKISILILADDSTKTVNNALTALSTVEIPAEEISRKAAEIVEENNNQSGAIKTVGSRLVATAKEEAKEITKEPAKEESNPEKGFASVATGHDPTSCSDMSDLSVNRASCIVHRASKTLSRRERRALQRKMAPRFDRFAGPNVQNKSCVINRNLRRSI